MYSKPKSVNTPGEKKRGFEGKLNRMVSVANTNFDKMVKNIRAKKR